MTTTVLDPVARAAAGDEFADGASAATCRIGLLGLGNVGGAFARLTREAAPALAPRGFAPAVVTALVRNSARPRSAAAFAGRVTDDIEAFFAEPVDIIVEALGGVEPANACVRRALDRGIPVVTANKSLMAKHGEALAQLARRRATALRFEASCIAGVPFLGTFSRRPLASRAASVTAILNGTSNSILTAMAKGARFDAALAEAHRLGFAEPDPTMDITGADAAEKLAILIRLFGRQLVDPSAVPLGSIAEVEPEDIAAAAAFEGAIRPIAQASWPQRSVHAFVGPAFVDGRHPLAHVAGVANGIVIVPSGEGEGHQCFIGPGAGPDVTGATLLDDVAELMTERRVLTPAPETAQPALSVQRPHSAWFVRLSGPARESEVADLLGSYGIWSTRLARRGDRTYALTCSASQARVRSALDALHGATGATASAFPALGEGSAC